MLDIYKMELFSTNNIFNNATLDNLNFKNNKLKINPITSVLWNDTTPDVWSNSGDRYYADSKNNWGGSFEPSGYCLTSILDVGDISMNIIDFEYTDFLSDEQQSIIKEVRYSIDNINWGEFKPIDLAINKFRYYQIKITFVNPNGLIMYIEGN